MNHHKQAVVEGSTTPCEGHGLVRKAHVCTAEHDRISVIPAKAARRRESLGARVTASRNGPFKFTPL
jgi:hypothetical protein